MIDIVTFFIYSILNPFKFSYNNLTNLKKKTPDGQILTNIDLYFPTLHLHYNSITIFKLYYQVKV